MAKQVGNPHDLCTWNENSDCESCPDQCKLHCKWDKRKLYAFFMMFFPFLVASWFGMAIVAKASGAWWPLVAYGTFYFVFFGFFEIRILCSHCPYYGGDSGFTLKCIANNGAMKIWKFHPEPMNRFEKASLVAGFVFLGGFPIYANFYGVYFVSRNYDMFGLIALLGMIAVASITVASSLSFFYVLRVYVCSKCVNFSCPVNAVPKDVVDEYLRRNTVMLKAWEESGYRAG